MIDPLPYWRGTVDRTLNTHGTEIGELRTDVDELQRSRWKAAGAIAAASILGSIIGGVITTVIAAVIISGMHGS